MCLDSNENKWVKTFPAVELNCEEENREENNFRWLANSAFELSFFVFFKVSRCYEKTLRTKHVVVIISWELLYYERITCVSKKLYNFSSRLQIYDRIYSLRNFSFSFILFSRKIRNNCQRSSVLQTRLKSMSSVNTHTDTSEAIFDEKDFISWQNDSVRYVEIDRVTTV